jgi:methionine-rich copper-binding protein CopC
MSKKTPMGAVTLIAAILCGGIVYAHPELQSADPAIGVATAASPNQIRIMFNESVIPKFSGIELKDQTGKTIATGKAVTDPSNKKLLVVPIIEQLLPGEYKVEWHAVSDDTHRVKGSYSFSVAR